MSQTGATRFPEGFTWGSATAAYQIEGAVAEDGRGPSIWDTFCAVPGNINDGTDGAVASDHYHRWPEDVALMADMGLRAYRFSLAWPRIYPTGKGKVNGAGLDFYDRLIDHLLENGVEPCPTLFHWDLPQALQDAGGWTTAEIVAAYENYADTVSQRYGDRIKRWFTHNEPNVFAFDGHATGTHAPGISDIATYMQVAHHLNLAHGTAVRAIRSNSPEANVGMVIHQALFQPISDSLEDQQAAAAADGAFNRLFTDPVLTGAYPDELQPLLETAGVRPTQQELEIIATPTDFLGVNHYTRYWIRHDPASPSGSTIDRDYRQTGASYTDIGWEVYPQGMYEVLMRLWRDYQVPLLITENGCAFRDTLQVCDGEAVVDDHDRIALLDAYLRAVHRAIADGCDIRGYFVWTFMDNFEWAEGLQKRFGLIHVDYDSLARTPKKSARWYADVIARNGLEPVKNTEGAA